MASPSRLQDLGRLARGLGLVAASGLEKLSSSPAGRRVMEGDLAGALAAAAKEGAELVGSMPGRTHRYPPDRRREQHREKGVGMAAAQSVDQMVASGLGGGLAAAHLATNELSAQAGISKRQRILDSSHTTRHADVQASVRGTGQSLRFTRQEAASSSSEFKRKVTLAGKELGRTLGQALDSGRSGVHLEAQVGKAFENIATVLESSLPKDQLAQIDTALDSASLAVRVASYASSHPNSQLRRILSSDQRAFDLQSAAKDIAELLQRAPLQPFDLAPRLRDGLEQGLQITKQIDRQLGLHGELDRVGRGVAEALFSWQRQAPSEEAKSSELAGASTSDSLKGFPEPHPGFGADVWSWIEIRRNSAARPEPSGSGMLFDAQDTSASMQPLAVGTHSPEERLDKLKAMSAVEHSERMPSQTDTGTVIFVAPGYDTGTVQGERRNSGGGAQAGTSKQESQQRVGGPVAEAASQVMSGAEDRDVLNFEREQSVVGESIRVSAHEDAGSSSSDSDDETGVPQKSKSGNAAAIEEPLVAQNKEERARQRAEESKRKEVERRTQQARERKVPAGPMARVLGFSQMAAGMAFGTLGESAGRLLFGGAVPGGNAFMSEGNAERLAAGLARMRGAALKLGQMLSIQDESVIPPQISRALERVRQGADMMPRKQLEKVLSAEQGPGWKSKLAHFDDLPMAAASIGQVHHATLKDAYPGGAYGLFREVAMKVQYPGVSESIDSDIENMRRILDWTDVIPKGLYLNHAIKIAKVELAAECDYLLEARSQKRYRQLLGDAADFYVPQVVDPLSSRRVLTTELVPGTSIDNVARMDEATRNRVAERLLRLTLQELFEFRFMQTDPNWGNFLYDEETDRIYLIDFGAARDFPKSFVDNYLEMVRACADKDKEGVIEYSKRLGFLTGDESKVMLDAHCQAAFVVGIPFARPGGFDFRTTDLTKRVTALGAVMLRHRLTPPPDEAYSLHRKLSGAFLACIKLGATVPCRDLFFKLYDNYDFESADVRAVA